MIMFDVLFAAIQVCLKVHNCILKVHIMCLNCLIDPVVYIEFLQEIYCCILWDFEIHLPDCSFGWSACDRTTQLN